MNIFPSRVCLRIVFEVPFSCKPMVLLVSLVLALIPLLGIVWIVLFGSITTVDGLFMS